MQANEALAAGSAERDLYHETHCKLRSSAAVGYVRYLHLNIVPRRGTDTSRIMLRMIVGPALRNHERVRWCLSHSCAPSELAVGFWRIRVPSGHGADWCSAMGGCVATAGRHSLLSLPRQLVNCSLSVSLPDNICISNAQYSSLCALRNPWCEILEF